MNGLLQGLSTSQKIKALLASRGISRSRLADTLGVHHQTIFYRLKHDRWDTRTIKKIAEAYNVRPEELI
jgi:transcriptional regulator with XRE-family HTH domain